MNFLLNTYFAYLVRTVVIFIVVVPGEPLRHLVRLRQGAVAALLLPQLTHPARRCRSVFPLKRLLQEAVGGYGTEHGRPSRRPPPRGGGRVRIGRLRDDGDHFGTEFTYNFLLSNVEIFATINFSDLLRFLNFLFVVFLRNRVLTTFLEPVPVGREAAT